MTVPVKSKMSLSKYLRYTKGKIRDSMTTRSIPKERDTMFKKKRGNGVSKIRQSFLANLREDSRIYLTHGVTYCLGYEKHWVERYFCIASFLISCAMSIYLWHEQHMRYIQKPHVTGVDTDSFDWNVSYPAVTMCPNCSGARQKKDIDEIEYYRSLFGVKANLTDIEAFEHMMELIMKTFEELLSLDNEEQGYKKLNEALKINPRDYGKLAMAAFPLYDYEKMTTNTNWPINVTEVMTEHGMCHTANSNVAVYDSPIKWANKITPTYKKTNIELSLYDKDFFAQVMDYADQYKIFIHSPDEIILATTPAYTPRKGFLSISVNVRSTTISDALRKASIEDRKCRFINEPISDRYPVYSYNHCLLECRIKMILRLCGCIPHLYKPLDHERICSLLELRCLAKYKKEILALAASQNTREKFGNSKDLPKNSRDCQCLSGCETYVYQKDDEQFLPQPDMNKVRIGLSSFPKYRFVKDVMFSFEDIILRSGGVLNLCLGTSVLSFAEILIAIIKILIYNIVRLLQSTTLRKKIK